MENISLIGEKYEKPFLYPVSLRLMTKDRQNGMRSIWAMERLDQSGLNDWP